MKSVHYRQILMVISLFLVVSTACNFPFGGINSDQGSIPISTEAVDSLQEEIQSALESGLDTGRINLVFDETELTSLFAFELQKSELSILDDPQVFLRDNHMQITGVAKQGNISARLDLVLDIYPTVDGRPAYDIVSATLGGFSVPENLRQELSHQIDMTIEGSIHPRVQNVFIETIEINDGIMIVDGYFR